MTSTSIVRRKYAPVLSNVASARAWTVDQLRDHAADLVGHVELVLSELMTNAIKAGATEVSIELRAYPRGVLVRVDDDAGGRVTLRSPTPTRPGGRGLPIVAALSTAWGVEGRPSGKRVWAALGITG